MNIEKSTVTVKQYLLNYLPYASYDENTQKFRNELSNAINNVNRLLEEKFEKKYDINKDNVIVNQANMKNREHILEEIKKKLFSKQEQALDETLLKFDIANISKEELKKKKEKIISPLKKLIGEKWNKLSNINSIEEIQRLLNEKKLEIESNINKLVKNVFPNLKKNEQNDLETSLNESFNSENDFGNELSVIYNNDSSKSKKLIFKYTPLEYGKLGDASNFIRYWKNKMVKNSGKPGKKKITLNTHGFTSGKKFIIAGSKPIQGEISTLIDNNKFIDSDDIVSLAVRYVQKHIILNLLKYTTVIHDRVEQVIKKMNEDYEKKKMILNCLMKNMKNKKKLT